MANDFEFYSPTRVIFGRNSQQKVGTLVRQYGGTRVLMVYGGKSASASPAGSWAAWCQTPT